MKLALIIFAVLSVIELVVYVPWLWRGRKIILGAVAFGLSVVGGMLFVAAPNVLGAVIFMAGLYRIFNNFRIISGRMNEQFAQRVGWRTSLQLIGLQLVCLGTMWGLHAYTTHGSTLWRIVAGLQLLLMALVAISFRNRLRRLVPPAITSFATKQELPTLSVCIPARNETESLQECLASLVASDYPKLEILVLDDCSQNRQTSQIIKDFAHEGVIFVKGEELKTGWLAKNQACQKLLDASSGDVLLFCGVDLRVQPNSLRLAVNAMIQDQWDMTTVLPKNSLTPGFREQFALVVQPLRYAYELLLPRWILRRPPVLSTCWLIRRELLTAGGAFEAVCRSIIPERHFAELAVARNAYGFMTSDDELGITNSKSSNEQLDTAIRLRYPQLHRRPELVCAITTAGLLLALLPVVLLGYSFHSHDVLLAILTLGAILAESVIYLALVKLTYRQFLRRSLLSLPLAIVADVVVLNISMFRYEFSEVNWKGRNVCLPVLRVIPHLPPLK